MQKRVSCFMFRAAVVVVSVLLSCGSSWATTFTENFSSNPFQNGWQIFGDTNLFQWNAAGQNMSVTWNSSQTNSYFYHSLGNILAIEDDFALEFDLNLADASAENYGSELAIGFLNIAQATSPDFSRSGTVSPNVAEFDYFPASMISASIDATLIDASNNYAFVYNTLPLVPGVLYHVRIAHAAGDPSLSGEVFTNGVLYASLTNSYSGTIVDFRLDTIAISSYQDDGYGDTVMAHGSVGNLVVTLPPPPAQNLTGSFTNGSWQVQFNERTNWLFTLQRSADLPGAWTDVSPTNAGVPNVLVLQDTNPPAGNAFYRVRAQRP